MASDHINTSFLLEQKWKKLTMGVDADVSSKWWNIIETKYTESNRKYHNFLHLVNMFCHMESVACEIQDKEAVSYAIFFHDIVYDPQKQENEEESTDFFRQFAEESGLNKNSELTNKVVEMIQTSKTHCTEEHKTEGAYGQDDVHYFLDFDVSILGSSPEDYVKYASQIAEEYSFLPPMKYNFLRCKVLQLFLQIPNIYATKTFREKYEMQARKNIQIEISNLSAKSGSV